jgi:FAD/FMN-containing dehydrogenase/Fe-S oxidoreductase
VSDVALASDLLRELRSAGLAEVDASNLGRALYSTDASLYRVVPSAIAFPRNVDEIVAALDVCRRLNVPFTTRGAGTSIAGNAIGTGLVIDLSRHMNNIIDIDVDAEAAVVEPGVVQASLQSAATKHGLRFGPDPSTSNRCSIGGMIGNNACGSRALAYGRTSDNVLGLEVVTGSGEHLVLDRSAAATSAGVLQELHALAANNDPLIRGSFGTFGRQVTGYAMEQLLPDYGFDVARFLVGSEGTLAVTLNATVKLVRDPAFRGLAVLAYGSMPEAADDVMAILPHQPTACEGLDARIVDAVRALHGPGRVPDLPDGKGWLFVEVVGDSLDEVKSRAAAVIADSASAATAVVTDPITVAHLWRIREDGAGLSSRTPDGRPAYAGWEDAAVPPAQLGAYLREFEALMLQHQIEGMPYGHFGDGCIHVRLSFPLQEENGPARMRAFLEDAARLVVAHGGSLSGEHGDGRARGELMKFMYSPEVLDLFAQVKNVFDPQGILNPGILVDPRPVDADLRAPQAPKRNTGLALAYNHDDGDFSKAVHRCTGVGKCRADTSASGGVMCPSFLATKNERDSTRGRARVLQEMVNGSLVGESWRSPEVHEALELCLSCKGCSTDCPTGVDMAAYKSEVLHQSYKGRLRPRSHYFLGWLPKLARLASRTPRIANALTQVPLLARLGKWAAGVDQRRSLPTFATQTFRAWFVARPAPAAIEGQPVVALFVDTFTNYFSPSVGQAAVAVLEDAGYRVELTQDGLCCGLTWISTGQLDTARSLLQKTTDALLPYADANIPVVGLEPSCTGVLRSDITELVSSPDAQRVKSATSTLAELLRGTDGWAPPDLTNQPVVAQPHCHHHAVMGWQEDQALLKDAGANVERLGGCCGLAGNFGVEQGHYDVSVAVGEQQLLPAVRNAGDDTVVLADGFSCRTQLDDLTDRRGQHLAELLASRLPKT